MPMTGMYNLRKLGFHGDTFMHSNDGAIQIILYASRRFSQNTPSHVFPPCSHIPRRPQPFAPDTTFPYSRIVSFQRALDDGVNFWTSLGSPHRFNVFSDGGQVQRRNFTRLDTWGPMDDSRGRGVQSYIDPISNPVDGGVSLSEYRIGTIPTQRQCEDALKRWFLWHDLDHEQAQDKVWSTLSCYAKNRSVDEIDNLAEWLSELPEEEVVDFKAIKFEVYKVLKLGGGASSREAHSRLYTRTTRSCNIFLRYQSYQEGIHPDEDGDSKLLYHDLLTGQLSFRGGDRRTHLQVSYSIVCLVIHPSYSQYSILTISA